MGYPKGKKRGPMPTSTRALISERTRNRWADPVQRQALVDGVLRSYRNGRQVNKKVHWTAEMDAELTQMRASMDFRSLRATAPKRIGVCDRAIIDRLHFLGLTRRRRIVVDWPAPVHIFRRPRSHKQPDSALAERQAAADRYLHALLNNGA